MSWIIHLTRAKHFAFNPRGYNIAADCAINCHIGFPDGDMSYIVWLMKEISLQSGITKNLKKKQTRMIKEMDKDHWDTFGDTLDDHSMWDEFEDDIIEEKVKGIADKAIKAQDKQGWGDISGNLAGQILAANKPKVNWKKEVRYFINKLVLTGRKNTRMRPNRRYAYQNPGTKRDYTSNLLVAFDTSGSVSDDQLIFSK